MADEEAASEAEAEAVPQGGGKKRLVLIILLCLIIAGISVGGTLTAIKMLASPAAPSSEEQEAAVEPTAEPSPAIYYPIKPEIIVTYQARGRQRYMQANISLMVRDESVISAVELHMPMVRNALNMIIGSQSYDEVQTAEGKELMRQQCLQELRTILEKETGEPGVDQVLFTNLILQ